MNIPDICLSFSWSIRFPPPCNSLLSSNLPFQSSQTILCNVLRTLKCSQNLTIIYSFFTSPLASYLDTTTCTALIVCSFFTLPLTSYLDNTTSTAVTLLHHLHFLTSSFHTSRSISLIYIHYSYAASLVASHPFISSYTHCYEMNTSTTSVFIHNSPDIYLYTYPSKSGKLFWRFSLSQLAFYFLLQFFFL